MNNKTDLSNMKNMCMDELKKCLKFIYLSPPWLCYGVQDDLYEENCISLATLDRTSANIALHTCVYLGENSEFMV